VASAKAGVGVTVAAVARTAVAASVTRALEARVTRVAPPLVLVRTAVPGVTGISAVARVIVAPVVVAAVAVSAGEAVSASPRAPWSS
jgi:hypothetical protein